MKNAILFIGSSATVMLALVALCIGVWTLESATPPTWWGYLCLLSGALLILIRRERCLDTRGISFSRLSRFAPAILFTASLCAAGYVINQILATRSYDRHTAGVHIAWWALSIGLCCLGAFLLDRRSPRTSPPLFDRKDYLLGIGIFALALAVRMAGPSGAALDEVMCFSEMRSLLKIASPPWITSATAYPYLFHWIIFFVAELLRDIIDPYDLEKLLSAVSASVSVAALYFTVRIFSPRYVALCASIILTFLGWHRVNSRFIYVYPHDFAFLMVGVLSALVAFQSGRILPAVVCGVASALALISAKIAVFALPFVFLIFLDYLRAPGETSRRATWKVAVGIALAFLVAMAPYFSSLLRLGVAASLFTRFGDATFQKERRLAAMGLSPSDDFFFVLRDAFLQLQISSYDTFRHYFRPGSPLLDPVLSLLATVGFVGAAVRFFRRRECRIALVGVFLFILPMILAFPLDSTDPHGLSRRMVGATFFIAWLGALGAQNVARVVFTERFVPRVAIVLCSCSAILNFYYFFSVYVRPSPYRWLSDHGIYRHAMIRAARLSGSKEIDTIVLENEMNRFLNAIIDFPSVKVVDSVDGLRTALRTGGSGIRLVIIPPYFAGTVVSSNRFRQELADVIPLHAWLPGNTDQADVPMFYKAYVELP